MTRLFTQDHEWIEIAGDTAPFTATVGITDFAQNALGDITFVELPAVGGALIKGATAGAIDSVKAASDIFAPMTGTVTEINVALNDEPELVNTSPELEGWLWRMTVTDASTEGLLDEAAYRALIAEL